MKQGEHFGKIAQSPVGSTRWCAMSSSTPGMAQPFHELRLMPQAVGDLFSGPAWDRLPGRWDRAVKLRRGPQHDIDLIVAVRKPAVRARTTVQRFDITTATVEGLLLLKLYALPSLYREGNFARVGLKTIATLLYYYQPDKTAIAFIPSATPK
jgi:hypothetical protein